VEEQEFLTDQRTLRLMCMSAVDKVTTKRLVKRNKRKAEEEKRVAKCSKCETDNKNDDYHDDTIQSSDTDNDDDDDEDKVVFGLIPKAAAKATVCSPEQITPRAPRRDMPNLSRVSDRYELSDICAAAVSSAVLTDFGIVTPKDKSKVIDKSKVRREREKNRLQLQTSGKPSAITGLYFDGRKDKTLINTKDGSTHYRRTVVQEHVSLIEEPGSSYLGHVTPDNGSAKGVAHSIVRFLSDSKISADKLVAVGCDRTNVNTGNKGGVIALLEQHYKKPLQWLVCQLHANELPFRHLLQHLDGETTGPRAFSGPIGKDLSACEQLPVKKYEKIEASLPTVNLIELSTDQQYLWEISNAVSEGHCPHVLSKREPGLLNHSRWLTTANRVLRLYVATENPSENLKTLAEYVAKVYAPMWFSIKTKPSCKDGSKHLWQTIKLSRYLPASLKKIIDPVLHRNGYFAHPETLLLGMISDERKHIRELGLRRIMKARSIRNPGVRKFVIPKLNYDSEEYYDLIDWQTTMITEPPLTVDISDSDIQQFVATGASEVISFPRFPCHTQAVERCVKLVTEASAVVCGFHSRDGVIRSKLEARRIMPTFKTKSEYRTESELISIE
jgi:hypothetical protein